MGSARLLWLVAAAAAVAAASAHAGPASDAGRAAHPGPNGRIAFASKRDGDWEIYTVSATGRGLRKLTSNRVDDRCPSWSPDGRWLAFTRTRPGRHADVHVMRADGRGVRRVIRSPGADHCPSWSPDGRRLAFTRVLLTLNQPELDIDGDVFTVGRDGRGLRRVTHRVPGFETSEWGRSGKIVLTVRKLDLDLWVYDPNGDGAEQFAPGSVRYPTWSPDGRRIAFVGDHEGRYDVYTVGLGGQDVRRVTSTDAYESWPAWSPDGRRIVHSGPGGLWTVGADGSRPRVLIRIGSALEADWGRVPAR